MHCRGKSILKFGNKKPKKFFATDYNIHEHVFPNIHETFFSNPKLKTVLREVHIVCNSIEDIMSQVT